MNSMNSPDYRAIHAQFVKNYAGMGPTETLSTILAFPLSNAIISLSLPWLLPSQYPYLPYYSRTWIQTLTEFVISIPLVILNMTVLSEHSYWTVGILLLIISCLMYLNCYHSPSPYKTMGSATILDVPVQSQRPSYLTNFRGAMMLATAICILAVDFPSFPRRFCKTETFGFSLMDTGVGGFTFIHGLSSASSRPKQSLFFREVKSSALLIGLGFLRLVSLEAVNYHEVVSEYGAHWNFFFTLAFTKIFCAWLIESYPEHRPLKLAVFIVGAYELLLKLGVENWILGDTPRNNFLSANREGIFSLLGYAALHFFAMEIKRAMNAPTNVRHLLLTWRKLAGIALVALIASGFFNSVSAPPSRRLANGSYVAWMVFYNLAVLMLVIALEILLKLTQYKRERIVRKTAVEGIVQTKELPLFLEPYLMRVINFNGMLFFLAANVLTGLVNLTWDTVHTQTLSSIVILTVHVLILICLTTTLYIQRWQFRLK